LRSSLKREIKEIGDKEYDVFTIFYKKGTPPSHIIIGYEERSQTTNEKIFLWYVHSPFIDDPKKRERAILSDTPYNFNDPERMIRVYGKEVQIVTSGVLRIKLERHTNLWNGKAVRDSIEKAIRSFRESQQDYGEFTSDVNILEDLVNRTRPELISSFMKNVKSIKNEFNTKT